MPMLLFAFVAAAIVAVFVFALRGKGTEDADGIVAVRVTPESSALSDEEIFDRYVGSMEEDGAETFPARIAGCTFRNLDGTDRQHLIRGAKAFDLLELRREPDSPFDKYAVQIVSQAGQQLGYLEKHVARETARKMDAGEVWIGTVRSVGRSDDGRHWGARIQLFGWPPGHKWK
jgi:hypothetical protein